MKKEVVIVVKPQKSAKVVGLMVGDEEGLELGSPDGDEEGPKEGDEEGVNDGSADGVDVGWPELHVGEAVGVAEGDDEGPLDGWIEGELDGRELGKDDGAPDGPVLGLDEGTSDGADEGMSVGFGVGESVGADEGTIDGADDGIVFAASRAACRVITPFLRTVHMPSTTLSVLSDKYSSKEAPPFSMTSTSISARTAGSVPESPSLALDASNGMSNIFFVCLTKGAQSSSRKELAAVRNASRTSSSV
ncbi:expressed unknown protein [Seminavis robusta]|uniref:Uncharacterized protein n=1 Tax=Seminavis robusta TaxID=568900 RepID=A0A9N8E1R0_9STRA|nr:expressed unknown protein [Seminavis robusta]|eukprot:Sro564_g167330.1 n/a (247) ;mRNA; f:17224-18330